ncbi:hypothetical protein Daus18300_007175 [Diaporthe australafricana]|uniref:DUF7708 domain-containing protein n=1 Tax=Diaporthe australafricana TaxID=127596 RepID=A0ABR3WQ23_9PEZI
MPHNQLAQAVNAVEVSWQNQDNQPTVWREWLRFDTPDEDPEIADLRVQAKEMADLWRKLMLDNGAVGLSQSEPPDMNTLMKAVHDGEVEWNKRKDKGFGKVKEKFKSFLETMHAHGYLFSVIPNGSMYTSLLIGVLTSVVKASTAHAKTAEGVSQALLDINMDLSFVRRGVQICSTPEMKKHVICLYKEVFEFLCYTMKWYSSAWQRLRKSIDAHYYDKEVLQRVDRIRGLVQRVRDELKLGTDERVRAIQVETRAGFRDTNTQIGALIRG